MSWGTILAIILYVLAEAIRRDILSLPPAALLSGLLMVTFLAALSLIIIGITTFIFVGNHRTLEQVFRHYLRCSALLGGVLMLLVMIIFLWVVTINLLTFFGLLQTS